jgi:hypothetical protein
MGVSCWRRSSSVGTMKGRESVEYGRRHAVLYSWVHFWESLTRSSSEQGMSGLRNLKFPIAFEVKIWRSSSCSRRCPWMISVDTFVFFKTLCMDSYMFPFVVT